MHKIKEKIPKESGSVVKAVVIARVSTEEQKEAGNSLPAQVIRLEKYCQNKGFPILRVCSFDESAYTDNRGTFDEIVDFILEQKEKIVVCCDKVDRLSRNIFDKRISLLYEKALSDSIELHFVSEGQVINSRISAVEKFQFGISLGLAKYYSDAISDNVRRSMEQKLRKGEWLSKALYGYKNIKENDRTDIIVDDHAAAIVRQTFAWYSTGAYSMELLCKKLRDEYHLKWQKGYVGKLLNNPFYSGTMIVKGKSYQHRYPTIVEQTLYDQVQQIKAGFLKKPAKYAGNPYAYRGLLRCGHCGLAITPEKHKGFVYYHCTQYRGKHGAEWLREEDITRQLSEVFRSLQVPELVLQEIVNTLDKVHQDKIEFHNKHYDTLVAEQKTLTKMMDNLYLDKLKGRIDDARYDSMFATLQEEADAVSIKLAQLKEAGDNYYATAKSLLTLSNRAHELFVRSEVVEKRQLIRLVLSNVRIEGKKVLYDAHKPFDVILDSAYSNSWRD